MQKDFITENIEKFITYQIIWRVDAENEIIQIEVEV
jgi:hypothetical protein